MTGVKQIIVEDHDLIWSESFDELKSVYEENLGDLICSVEHVGSTAVEGLCAKPIIDLDLVVDDKETLSSVIEKLEMLGYIHVGDLGIVGREAFKRKSSKVPVDGSNRSWTEHHLYTCLKDSVSLQNHLLLRDHLRENSDARREYGELKKELARNHRFDIDSYIEGKTAFILNILKDLNLDTKDLKLIEVQNMAK